MTSLSEQERYLTPKELAERWRNQINVATLANWRCEGRGPAFVKIGTRVLYPLRDIVAYETQSRRTQG